MMGSPNIYSQIIRAYAQIIRADRGGYSYGMSAGTETCLQADGITFASR